MFHARVHVMVVVVVMMAMAMVVPATRCETIVAKFRARAPPRNDPLAAIVHATGPIERPDVGGWFLVRRRMMMMVVVVGYYYY